MPRYADHPTTSVHVDVAASPERLWPLISDITVPVGLSGELQAAEWVPPHTGPAPGAVFEGTNRHPAIGTWKVRCHVAVCEPGRAFGWDPGGPDAPFTKWCLFLDPVDDSTTRLTFWAQMGLGPSGLTPVLEAMPDHEEEIVQRRLDEWRDNMAATVEGIRALAEGGGGGNALAEG